METMVMRLSDIRIDGGTQSRAEVIESIVDEYANLIVDGVIFPPPVVFFDGTDSWLGDGFHRYNAHKLVGKSAMKVEIRRGAQRDAMLFSVSANQAHGLRRSNADKRHAVAMLLADEVCRKWSDRAIADKCGVSNMLVADVRAPEKAAGRKAAHTRLTFAPDSAPSAMTIPALPSVRGSGITISDGQLKDLSPRTAYAMHNGVDVPRDDSLDEDPIAVLSDEITRLNNRLAAAAMGDATDEERAMALQGLETLQRELLSLRAERDGIAVVRDAYMRENAELKSEVKRLRKKLDQVLANH